MKNNQFLVILALICLMSSQISWAHQTHWNLVKANPKLLKQRTKSVDGSPITGILVTADNHKLIATTALGGIFKYIESTNSWVQFTPYLPNKQYINDIYINNNNIYTATVSGVYTCKISNCHWQALIRTKDDEMWEFAKDESSLYVLSATGNIYQINEDLITDSLPKIKNTTITSIYNNDSGELLVGTENGKLYEYDEENWHLVTEKTTIYSKQQTPIWVIEQFEGAVYLGDNSEVSRFENGKIMPLGGNKSLSHVNNQQIWNIVATKNHVFAGTSAGKLYDYTNGNWKEVQYGESSAPDQVTSIRLSGNTLYIGTMMDNVYAYDINTSKTQKLGVDKKN